MMVKRLIQGVAFLAVAGITELSLSCPQSTFTIDPTLDGHQRFQTSTVAFAWTGAHFSGGVWADRKNPNNVISSKADGTPVSQSYSSSFTHGANRDASSASASAQCNLPTCQTASLSTSACVTSKVDSAGAGAYARAGITVPPKKNAAKTGTVMINIPGRMTLTSNVGDEAGAWGIAVRTTKHKSLVDKGHLDVAPFLVELLGLKDEKEFNEVHSAEQLYVSFVAGFELDPQGTTVKLIGPDRAEWKTMTAEQQKSATATLEELRKRFVIRPCPTDGKDSMGLVNKNCHTAEYLLDEKENKSIEVPYEFPEEPKNSKSEQILFIEVGHAGRDHIQEKKDVIDNGSAGK